MTIVLIEDVPLVPDTTAILGHLISDVENSISYSYECNNYNYAIDLTSIKLMLKALEKLEELVGYGYKIEL